MTHKNTLNHWDSISLYANTKIIQLTILVPVLGYLIIFSEWFENNFRVFGYFPTWKIYSLYFGFTFIALGSIIYNIFCPKLVQQYTHTTEYINKELSYLFDIKRNELLKDILFLDNSINTDINNLYSYPVSSFISSIDINDYKNTSVLNKAIATEMITINDIQPFMYAYFELLKISKKFARNTVVLLYIIGFGLVFVPSLIMFIEISAHAYSQILQHV